MSTAYGGVNTYPTTIPIPSDGDLKNAATVGAALEGLMDAATALALQHLGTNPAGILKAPTIRGNASYTRDGANRSHSFVDVAITIDDLSAITINGPAATSPTISISRNMNWPQGSHTFGGAASQDVSFACPTLFSQPISLLGYGRIRKRRQYTATINADRTININACDVYIVRLGDLASGNKGILTNGTGDGTLTSWDTIRIVSFDTTAFPLYAADGVTALFDANTSSIVLKKNPSAPGEYASVELMWTGARWEWIGQ